MVLVGRCIWLSKSYQGCLLKGRKCLPFYPDVLVRIHRRGGVATVTATFVAATVAAAATKPSNLFETQSMSTFESEADNSPIMGKDDTAVLPVGRRSARRSTDHHRQRQVLFQRLLSQENKAAKTFGSCHDLFYRLLDAIFCY